VKQEGKVDFNEEFVGEMEDILKEYNEIMTPKDEEAQSLAEESEEESSR